MELHIGKMACGGCVNTVTAAITAIDPAARISADTGSRTVTIETTAGRERIEKALADAGYPAQAV